eukprot:gene10703-12660_t
MDAELNRRLRAPAATDSSSGRGTVRGGSGDETLAEPPAARPPGRRRTASLAVDRAEDPTAGSAGITGRRGSRAANAGHQEPPGEPSPMVAPSRRTRSRVAAGHVESPVYTSEEAAIMRRVQEIRTQVIPDKAPPKFPEPARNKTHWDFLLEEMAWLAKDMEKERRWKMKQAKRFTQAVIKGRLDVVSRTERREKDEELRIRRVASGISREVKKFWSKIEKLVVFKHHTVVEKQKKEALDKHLTFLLSQTEKYSKVLADDLTQYKEKRAMGLLEAPPGKPSKAGALGAPVGASSGGLSAGHEAAQIKQEGTEGAAEGATEGGAGEDMDFVVGEEEDGKDDEATLEAEERLAVGDEDDADELHTLQQDSEIPIEELLRQYHEREAALGQAEEGQESDSAEGGDTETTPEGSGALESSMLCDRVPDVELPPPLCKHEADGTGVEGMDIEMGAAGAVPGEEADEEKKPDGASCPGATAAAPAHLGEASPAAAAETPAGREHEPELAEEKCSPSGLRVEGGEDVAIAASGADDAAVDLEGPGVSRRVKEEESGEDGVTVAHCGTRFVVPAEPSAAQEVEEEDAGEEFIPGEGEGEDDEGTLDEEEELELLKRYKAAAECDDAADDDDDDDDDYGTVSNEEDAEDEGADERGGDVEKSEETGDVRDVHKDANTAEEGSDATGAAREETAEERDARRRAEKGKAPMVEVPKEERAVAIGGMAQPLGVEPLPMEEGDVEEEYVAVEGEDEDDESTLEAEMAVAQGLGEADPAAEMDALQRESEMPIEELLALYRARAREEAEHAEDEEIEAERSGSSDSDASEEGSEHGLSELVEPEHGEGGGEEVVGAGARSGGSAGASDSRSSDGALEASALPKEPPGRAEGGAGAATVPVESTGGTAVADGQEGTVGAAEEALNPDVEMGEQVEEEEAEEEAPLSLLMSE